jgi:3-hydroxybutyryl-CoA dehydratase
MSVMKISDETTLIPIGYSFSSPLFLSEEDIIDGAKAVGDFNPIHSTSDNQHPLGFKTVIASGSHVTGLFSAMIPTEFSKFGPMIGAQMTLKFLRPILPNVTYSMEWVVNKYEWKVGLKGYLYKLSGKIIEEPDDPSDLIILVRADADIIYYGSSRS